MNILKYPLHLKSEAMVPQVGLEPTRLATTDFESAASTNFATGALALNGVCANTIHTKLATYNVIE